MATKASYPPGPLLEPQPLNTTWLQAKERKNMQDNFELVIARYRKYIADGESTESIIYSLHQNDFTIIESIKVLRIIYHVDLGKAKALVTQSPVWSDVVESHKELHEQLEEIFMKQIADEEGKG